MMNGRVLAFKGFTVKRRASGKNAASPWYYTATEVSRACFMGEGMEKREPSYTVGGNVNWHSCYGK